MADLDGQLILETLYSLEQPATLKTILSTVAEAYGAETNQVRDAVKKILKAGVAHGFVQYAQGKYYAENVDEVGDVNVKVPTKTTGDKQPEDATRRRRRSTSRRRQRSGSRRSHSRPRRRSRSSTRR